MTTSPSSPPATPATSFGLVADAYARARPSYPDAAVTWLTGARGIRVLELGAGTGKLTAQLTALGHRVVASDPSEEMLRRLVSTVPRASALRARAECIPLRGRSADAVLAAQSFHWFDPEPALREVARVLRTGGTLGLVWNRRDERVPWVRRLGRIIGSSPDLADPRGAIDESGMFATVETSTYRFWQPHTRTSLRELVLSRSAVAMLDAPQREPVLAQVDALYDDYGRGPDGMLLPYVTTAFRTTVLPWAAPQEPARSARSQPPADPTESLLIDFH